MEGYAKVLGGIHWDSLGFPTCMVGKWQGASTMCTVRDENTMMHCQNCNEAWESHLPMLIEFHAEFLEGS